MCQVWSEQEIYAKQAHDRLHLIKLGIDNLLLLKHVSSPVLSIEDLNPNHLHFVSSLHSLFSSAKINALFTIFFISNACAVEVQNPNAQCIKPFARHVLIQKNFHLPR